MCKAMRTRQCVQYKQCNQKGGTQDMTFAEKLRKARQDAGMTQKDLSQKSHVAIRNIASYELGEHLPRKNETYDALADALGVTADSLKDGNSDFILKAKKQYGGRGSRQAEALINSFRVAAAGGELDDNDLDFIKDAMMETYWEAKKYNQRFRNKQYAKDKKDDGE